MLARLFVTLQYLVPKHLLTRLVYRIARVRAPTVKDFLIARFVQLYDVDVDEVRGATPDDFASLNEFFVRELADGARPVDGDPRAVVAPVDGTVSQAGRISADTIWQAKGLYYSLDDLLATDLDTARAFVDGSYATIYLAPYNYHRVHAAFDGTLEAIHYVPGNLFSVNAATVERIPGLFRRNERLILHFSTPAGPCVQILVGALNVGSISTPWTGEVRPRKSGVVENCLLGEVSRDIRKGDLLGWFNMGSTVIVLLPAGACEWRDALTSGATVRMGEVIGTLQ